MNGHHAKDLPLLLCFHVGLSDNTLVFCLVISNMNKFMFLWGRRSMCNRLISALSSNPPGPIEFIMSNRSTDKNTEHDVS